MLVPVCVDTHCWWPLSHWRSCWDMHTATTQLDQVGRGHMVMWGAQEVWPRGNSCNIPQFLKECGCIRGTCCDPSHLHMYHWENVTVKLWCISVALVYMQSYQQKIKVTTAIPSTWATVLVQYNYLFLELPKCLVLQYFPSGNWCWYTGGVELQVQHQPEETIAWAKEKLMEMWSSLPLYSVVERLNRLFNYSTSSLYWLAKTQNTEVGLNGNKKNRFCPTALIIVCQPEVVSVHKIRWP